MIQYRIQISIRHNLLRPKAPPAFQAFLRINPLKTLNLYLPRYQRTLEFSGYVLCGLFHKKSVSLQSKMRRRQGIQACVANAESLVILSYSPLFFREDKASSIQTLVWV